MLIRSSDILAPEPLDIGQDRVATILHTIERGWQLARVQPGIQAGVPENELNEYLRDGMRAAAEPRTGGRGPRMQVLPSAQTRSGSHVRTPDGVPDIPLCFPAIFGAYHEHDPHALIECKRIAGGNRRLCREYVKEGIDRFVSGQYAARHLVGFMAGYLDAGDANLATEGINRYLVDYDRHDEVLGSPAELKADWAKSSRHARARSDAPIDLHHAFLAFN